MFGSIRKLTARCYKGVAQVSARCISSVGHFTTRCTGTIKQLISPFTRTPTRTKFFIGTVGLMCVYIATNGYKRLFQPADENPAPQEPEEEDVLSSLGPYTASGMAETYFIGNILSGVWDLSSSAFLKATESTENALLYLKDKTIEKFKDCFAPKETSAALPKNKKKRRKVQKDLARHPVQETEQKKRAEQKKSISFRIKLFIFCNVSLQLIYLGYFMVSLIDPLKKWINYTAVNNYRDEGDNDKRLYFEESLAAFKEPDTFLEKMMKPPISMTLALGLFMYNFLEGTRLFSKKDNLNEIPLGRVARTLGFLLLSESALIKHDKLFASSYLSKVFEPNVTNDNLEALALTEYAQMMAAGIDHTEAMLKIGFMMRFTQGVIRDQALRLHEEKRVWLQYAKLFKFF